MKPLHSLLVCLMTLCGCHNHGVETPIIPWKTNVTAGHRHSAEATRFLDAPDATRREVIATLGPPLVDSRESRVLLYTWEKTRRMVPFRIVSIDRDHSTGAETRSRAGPQRAVATSVQRWGLFIAYDDDGLIRAHEVRKIGTTDLEGACVMWRRTLQKDE